MPECQKTVRALGVPGLKAAVFLFLWLGILLSGLPAQEEDEEEVVIFKGVGIHLRLGGGYSLLSGGDFDKGVRGMYDWGCQSAVSGGYTLGKSDVNPFRSGLELGGDIVYYFAGRLGIGLGGTLAQVKKTNKVLFEWGAMDFPMTVVPQVNVLTLRLGLFYALPLNRLLTVCLNAGPAYYSAEYKLSHNLQKAGYLYDVLQEATAKGWGVQGGIGLEVRMNPRLALILEAQGRYAKISGFDGQENLYELFGGPFVTSEKKGILYYLEAEGFPRLEIFPETPEEGFNTREAVLDFSGVSFRAGLNFKF